MHRVSRRLFTQSCIAATVAGFSSISARAAESYPRGKFVDFHTHLGQTWNTTKDLTADALLKWMDEHEVAQACVLPLVSPESSSYLLTTDSILAKTQPHRDRLIPFCCIDPRTTFTGGPKALQEMLQKYVDQGAKGFGEHKPGVPVDHPHSMAIYSVCGRLGLPILFHLDNMRNTDVPGLPGLEKAIKEHPDTVFIGHGNGWWASISGNMTKSDLGGYPTGAVTPGGAMERLMDAYPNIYADLSAGSGAGALQRDMKFAREFLIRRQDRIVFGTDYLSPGQPVPQFEVLSKLDLPEEVATKIFRGNARRLLRI